MNLERDSFVIIAVMHSFLWGNTDKKPYQCDQCNYNSIYKRTFRIHHARCPCASSDAFQKEFQSCIRYKEAWELQMCSVGNDALYAKCHNISLQKMKIFRVENGMFWIWGQQFWWKCDNKKEVYIWQPFEARNIETWRPNDETPGLHFNCQDPKSIVQIQKP